MTQHNPHYTLHTTHNITVLFVILLQYVLSLGGWWGGRNV